MPSKDQIVQPNRSSAAGEPKIGAGAGLNQLIDSPADGNPAPEPFTPPGPAKSSTSRPGNPRTR